MPASLQLVANGNISPAVFVKLDTANDDYVLQSTAGTSSHGDPTIGVSGVDTDRAPLSDLIATQYHAQQGEPCRVYQAGEICLLTIGAAVTVGQRLKSDANGNGIPESADGDYCGAVSLESSTVVGSQVRVVVLSPQQQAAA